MEKNEFFNIINLPKFIDHRGSMTYFESGHQIPFFIQQTVVFQMNKNDQSAVPVIFDADVIYVCFSGILAIKVDMTAGQNLLLMNSPDQALWIHPKTKHYMSCHSEKTKGIFLSSKKNNFIG